MISVENEFIHLVRRGGGVDEVTPKHQTTACDWTAALCSITASHPGAGAHREDRLLNATRSWCLPRGQAAEHHQELVLTERTGC